MEKNTGKTECLNYIIKRLRDYNKVIAVTSIGIDGESVDQVTETPKPEIEISDGVLFVTSEKHFKQKQIIAEVLNISSKQTSLGRLVTARAKNSGKLIFSGPPDTVWLKQIIGELSHFGAETILVDGALSRKSSGSPSVTEGMILTTGAALSANIPTLVKKTKFVCTLINIGIYQTPLTDILLADENGISIIDNNCIHNTGIKSTLLLEKSKDKLFGKGNTYFVSGIVTDKLIDLLRIQPEISETVLVVKDFTKLFVSPEKYSAFITRGGQIKVLLKTNFIAICINPTSPEGFILDSDKLKVELQKNINVPVYDIKNIASENI
jgi:hypothetical protein